MTVDTSASIIIACINETSKRGLANKVRLYPHLFDNLAICLNLILGVVFQVFLFINRVQKPWRRHDNASDHCFIDGFFPAAGCDQSHQDFGAKWLWEARRGVREEKKEKKEGQLILGAGKAIDSSNQQQVCRTAISCIISIMSTWSTKCMTLKTTLTWKSSKKSWLDGCTSKETRPNCWLRMKFDRNWCSLIATHI